MCLSKRRAFMLKSASAAADASKFARRTSCVFRLMPTAQTRLQLMPRQTRTPQKTRVSICLTERSACTASAATKSAQSRQSRCTGFSAVYSVQIPKQVRDDAVSYKNLLSSDSGFAIGFNLHKQLVVANPARFRNTKTCISIYAPKSVCADSFWCTSA